MDGGVDVASLGWACGGCLRCFLVCVPRAVLAACVCANCDGDALYSFSLHCRETGSRAAASR